MYSLFPTVQTGWRRLAQAAAIALLAVGVAALVHGSVQDVRLLSVQTASMAPALAPGDAVLVRPVGSDAIRQGDIVSFQSPADPGVAVTHRVVGFDAAGRPLTQGDANVTSDGPLDRQLLIGRVERQFGGLGYVLDFMRSWLGLVLLLYVPAAAVTVSELRRLAGYFRLPYYHAAYDRR